MFPTTDLHPMLVHFPIALVLAGFLFEAMSLLFKKDNSFGTISFYLLIFGTAIRFVCVACRIDLYF